MKIKAQYLAPTMILKSGEVVTAVVRDRLGTNKILVNLKKNGKFRQAEFGRNSTIFVQDTMTK